MSELVLNNSDDGRTQLDQRLESRSVWLTQLKIAELFHATKQNVSLHVKDTLKVGELSPEATVKEFLTVQNEGRHPVHIFPELAELSAKQHRDLTLDYWLSSVDRMLTSSYQPLLVGPGSVSHQDMKAIEDQETDLKRRGSKA